MANIFDLFKKIEKKESAPAGPVTHLIVGLGNPGKEYVNTRHNAGFLALDYIAERIGTQIDRARFKGLAGEGSFGEHRVLLLKPQTYMNLSGEAVREAASFYKIAPENVIVIADDVNFAAGKLRVRGKGSDGGHNGLKSIIAQLQSNNFPRVKVGVGVKPHPEYDLADWVLGKLPDEDMKRFTARLEDVFDSVKLILMGDIDGAMSKYSK